MNICHGPPVLVVECLGVTGRAVELCAFRSLATIIHLLDGLVADIPHFRLVSSALFRSPRSTYSLLSFPLLPRLTQRWSHLILDFVRDSTRADVAYHQLSLMLITPYFRVHATTRGGLWEERE